MQLLLLRHGQTPANVLGQLDTAVPGAPLTGLGMRQAAAIPAGLNARGLPTPGRLAVSSLVRTQLTAQPLAATLDLTPEIVPGLEEIRAGDLELLSDKHSQGLYNATTLAWARGDIDVRMPGGERGRDFFDRYDDAILRATRAGAETVAIVSHGAAIRVWVAARASVAGLDFAATHQLLNTGLARLESRRDTVAHGPVWRLVEWIREPVGGEMLGDAAADDPTGRDTADPATSPDGTATDGTATDGTATDDAATDDAATDDAATDDAAGAMA